MAASVAAAVAAVAVAAPSSIELAQPDSTETRPGYKSTNLYVGIYLRDISGFDLKDGRFHADLDIWMKWLGPKDIAPLRFSNAEIQTMKETSSEADGNWRSRRWRVQGTFRGNFPLHAFPFDQQELKIGFEYPIGERVLKPDLAGSGTTHQFSTTGWLFDPSFRVESTQSTHHSDFGSIVHEGNHCKFNNSASFWICHAPSSRTSSNSLFRWRLFFSWPALFFGCLRRRWKYGQVLA